MNEIEAAIREAEEKAKAVWEIDGTTVYVTDITMVGNKITTQFFTFDEEVDKVDLSEKVENLARILFEEQRCSRNSFWKIWSRTKLIIGKFFRTLFRTTS